MRDGAAPPLFVLCQRWLTGFGIASLLIGLALIFATETALFTAYNETIARAFWGTAELGREAALQNRWALGTAGAGTAGWAIAFIYLAAVPFRRRERWAHDCFVVSVAVWVLLDVYVAVIAGVEGELWFVLSAAVGAGIPLALSRKFFTGALAASPSQ